MARLSIPVYLRALFCVLSNVISALVLSSMDSRTMKTIKATGACVNIFVVVFKMVSSNVVTIVSRGVKTKEPKVTCRTERLKLVFGTLVNVMVSIILTAFSNKVLEVMDVTPTLLRPTRVCLEVINNAYFLGTLVPVFSDCLEIFKCAGRSLVKAIIKGILGVVLGSMFLFTFG